MDKGAEVPKELQEETETSIRESLSLLEKWNNRADGRIRYCFAPRFAVSCTKELLERVAHLSRKHGVMIHTHASENKTEIEIVENETGLRNIIYLDSVGLAASHVLLAHCIHLNDEEIEILTSTKTKVSHCPSSNLKLGSGIARVKELLERDVYVSLGADGAPCNNRLDMFTEMRSASLLQKVIHGPEALPAQRTLRMATIDGAKALGLENEIGSLEEGKKADIIIVDLKSLHASPHPTDIVSALVYSAQSSDVLTTIIGGNVLMRERNLLTMNESKIIQEANRESKLLMQRAGILD
jgi:cytosine/adenosine deaminase-related metal-dependent hydrolase